MLTQHGDLELARGCGRGLPLHRRDLRSILGVRAVMLTRTGRVRLRSGGCGRSRTRGSPYCCLGVIATAAVLQVDKSSSEVSACTSRIVESI